MELSNDHRTVLGTLPFRPAVGSDEEDVYATSAAVTEVVPFGADKTRRLLGELVAEGVAEEAAGARPKRYRRAVTEEEQWALDDAAAATQSAHDATDAPGVDDGASDASDAPTVAQGAPAGNDVASVKAFMASVRPAPKVEPEDVKEPVTGTCSVVGCGKAIHKEGRSWVHDDGDVSHKATTAKQREPRKEGERPAGAPPIYQKGALKDKIIAWLRAQPEGESFGASAVAKAVEGQSGSVQFALDAFVSKGEAKLTQEKPKRYAAA